MTVLRSSFPLFAAFLLATACAGKESNAKSPDGASEEAGGLPRELAEKIERSASLGQTLYLYDQASAVGTDVLLSNVKLEQHPLGGYVTLADADEQGKPTGSFSVVFYTRDKEPRVAFKIRVHPEGKQPEFEASKPPALASDALSVLIRARETALAAPRDTEQPMNPVVLPGRAIGEEGIVVYLIAGTKQPKVAVLGKHYRVLVGDDGKTLKRSEALSNAVIELPYGEAEGGTPAALTVTHPLTDYPLETHVFASLLYKLPILVTTERGVWKVDGATITFQGKP